MTIGTDLKKAEKLTLNATEKAIRGVALKLFTAIVEGTRVDTGRLKGNVRVNMNTPASGELDVKDKSGGATTRKGEGELNTYNIQDTIFINNTLPYARLMEEGTSRTPGDNLWKRTVSLFGRELEKQSKKNRIR